LKFGIERTTVINRDIDQVSDNDSGHHDIGLRFRLWCMHTESGLTPQQKADAYEQWALEFEQVPRRWEPYAGWAAGLADSARRLARHERGEAVDWSNVPTAAQTG
jgi:hypothetical protein